MCINVFWIIKSTRSLKKSSFVNMDSTTSRWIQARGKISSFRWRGSYSAKTVLCFGWCVTPFAHYYLSKTLLARYLPCVSVHRRFLINRYTLHKPCVDVNSMASDAGGRPHRTVGISRCLRKLISQKKFQLGPTSCVVFLEVLFDIHACRIEVPGNIIG